MQANDQWKHSCRETNARMMLTLFNEVWTALALKGFLDQNGGVEYGRAWATWSASGFAVSPAHFLSMWALKVSAPAEQAAGNEPSRDLTNWEDM